MHLLSAFTAVSNHMLQQPCLPAHLGALAQGQPPLVKFNACGRQVHACADVIIQPADRAHDSMFRCMSALISTCEVAAHTCSVLVKQTA